MVDKRQFLPTLLDRLLDDEPKKQHEAADKSFHDGRTLRRLVQRDLTAVLNCVNIERELCPVRHQDIAQTVLNYGISPLAGSPENRNNGRELEQILREAILRFEPRIIPQSLIVKGLNSEKDRPFKHGKMLFEIRGLIYWEPYPLDLCLSGEYDNEREGIEFTAV
ncbi:type VI secretion system baseplate subunit TssE [Lelliottia sp. JS-SCA-14]|uniref:type VI secretion system baseplate subunit TssE n=1 Tax=Lelliottia sp. JS-SCA-14 TaxID=3110110 RepID=UPI003A5D06B1